MNPCTMRTFVSVSLLSAFLIGCSQTPDIVFTQPDDVSAASLEQTASVTSAESEISSAETETPTRDSVLIKVPFVAQAPFANWDALHQEACEEMSMLLVKHYLEGTSVGPELAEKELQDTVSWMDDVGLPYDVTMEELGRTAEELWKLNARVEENVTIESIKEELSKGNPVILPFAGQQLGNPYFSGDGPPYHVLVVIGFDGKNFITNDVGTKRGASYKYDQDVLFSAIHDWTGSKETIEQGPKKMLVLSK
jgi:hypothetical protein